MTKTDPNLVYCSFCGKTQHDVGRMIAGPTVFICDGCIEMCMGIIREESGKWLANRNGEIGPCMSEVNLSLLMQSGYTVADLLRDGGIGMSNFDTADKMDLKVTLAHMAAGMVQRLAIATGPEGMKARISQMRDLLAESEKKFDEAAVAYRKRLVDRSDHSLNVHRLKALEDRLARHKADSAQITAIGTTAT